MKATNLKPENARRDAWSFGLIGYPLGHSLSPQIHAAALYALGMSGEYSLYPVNPASSQSELENLLSRMRAGEIHGLNITIPYKQEIIPLLDALTPDAAAIGAVNTIFSVRSDDFSPPPVRSDSFRDLSLIGDNTDAAGFWADLDHHFDTSARQPSNALVLGAGGSARAVTYALLTHGWRVTLAARRIEQAEEPRDQFSTFSSQLSAASLSSRSGVTGHCSLIVNTTPVGMSPHKAHSPWPEGNLFPQNAVVYDLVYNPPETLLVRQAREAGLRAAAGLGMLVEQAALAFERWTGAEPPRQAMREAVPTHE